MSVIGLGYLGLGVSDIASWRAFMGEVLGTQVSDADGGSLKVRVDSRDWRISIQSSGEDDLVYVGWETAGPGEMAATVTALEAAGTATTADPDLAKARGVMGLVRFVDPCGLNCELFWGATERRERPFVSPTGTRFVLGDQGLGHIVIASPDPMATLGFYRDVLGFGFSDHIDMPQGPHIVPVTFMHCNPRHHTFAFAPVPSPKKLLHFMLQTETLDDVGFALDRASAHGVDLSLTLGRHVNDLMVSFYAYTPSGFEVEFGTGAQTIDPATWLPARHDRISTWGHRFVGRPGTIQA